MAISKKPKRGFVYLLNSQTDKSIYKFGCTTLSTKERCNSVNRESQYKGFKFKVISSFESGDMFKDENLIRWKMFPFGLGSIGESFSILELNGFRDKENQLNRLSLIGLFNKILRGK
tara:strand:- start:483 stop:833 length:351 start_codon:yes stop_codon:yes gene_type:complete